MNESSKYLLIKAKGGLGNRILAAVTGLIYADLARRTPVIDWRDGTYAPVGVNAYPVLFDGPPMVAPDELEEIEDVSPEIWCGNLDQAPTNLISKNDPNRHSDPFIYRKYCVDLRCLTEPARLAVYWSYLPKFERLRSGIRASGKFEGKTTEEIARSYLQRYFTPNQRICTEVSNMLSGIPRPIVGVHIRFTDMKVPLEKIEGEIIRAKSRFENASIFLATDNEDVNARIQQKFDNVYTIPKWFPEEDHALHQNPMNPDQLFEAENALIDMWTLAGCDALIYAKRSTFSYTSKIIGGISSDNEIDIDRSNVKIILKRLIQSYA